jgi:spermidine synthase
MSTPTATKQSLWYEEPSHEGCLHKFEFSSVDMEAQSAFQAVEVINTTTYGKMLMLDKQVQSSSMDEFIYHESLVHPTLLSLPEPAKRVFIGKNHTIYFILQ